MTPLRALYMALGILMVAIGAVGVVLPLLPTTIFLILAAWFFARSSPRLERWLMNHPRFGPTLTRWRDHGGISRPAKAAALVGMTSGYAVFWWQVEPGPGLAILVAAALAGCAIYVVSRPAGDTPLASRRRKASHEPDPR